VIVERTVRELNGESCLALEDAPPPKQQIVVSRSFGQRVTSIEDLQQAVVTYATRASEKLREQGSKCQHVSVSVNTGAIRERTTVCQLSGYDVRISNQ
jgi:DNA polymerase V